MLIDIVFVVLMIIAVVKGYQRGLIVGVFSLVSIIIGLAAAIKLSAVVAGYIGKAVNISDKWLPVVSFLVVFIGVVLLVRLGANLIQKAVEGAMLGWINKLGGVLFYAVLYIIVYSILLFYAEKTGLITEEGVKQSAVYSFIQPWGPKVIDALGALIPIFRNMFAELETFFGGVAEKIPPESAG